MNSYIYPNSVFPADCLLQVLWVLCFFHTLQGTCRLSEKQTCALTHSKDPITCAALEGSLSLEGQGTNLPVTPVTDHSELSASKKTGCSTVSSVKDLNARWSVKMHNLSRK